LTSSAVVGLLWATVSATAGFVYAAVWMVGALLTAPLLTASRLTAPSLKPPSD
jgi:hypothetical protein